MSHAGERITVGNHAWLRDNAQALLGSQFDTLLRNVSEMTRVPLGIYRSLRSDLVLYPQFPPGFSLVDDRERCVQGIEVSDLNVPGILVLNFSVTERNPTPHGRACRGILVVTVWIPSNVSSTS